jgi:predicted transport protein
MAENIELWGYSRYEKDVFELKLIASSQAKTTVTDAKQISKANYDEYSVADHIKNKSESIKELFFSLQEKIFALESEQKIEESPRKLYIAYKVGRGFVEVKLQKNNIKIWIAKGIDDPKGMIRDVSNIGHHGVGNSEITLSSFDELDYVIGLIEQSYLQSI